MPMTLRCAWEPGEVSAERPDHRFEVGLVMQMTKAFGQLALMPSPTDFITLRLMPCCVIAAHPRFSG